MVQSTNSGVSDKVLGELALKIEAELPEEIARFVTFKQDGDAKNLVVDWSVQLAPEDLKLLTDVVTGYGGSYEKLKDPYGKDRGCFTVPRNQPPPSVTSYLQPKEPQKPPQNRQLENQASLDPAVKQQSPLTIFQGNHCNSCSDQATCTPKNCRWQATAINLL